MGRIREHIKVNGHTFWTLFDTGARNTYVVPEVASLLATTKLEKPFRSRLGGSVKKTTKAALLVAQVQRHRISTNAMVVSEIGNDEEGKQFGLQIDRAACRHFRKRFLQRLAWSQSTLFAL